MVKEFFRRELPQVAVVSQDELMGAKLADYLDRHLEIDLTLSREAECEILVSELNPHYGITEAALFPDLPVYEKEKNNGG